ncbi:MAG: hypothetical protein ABJB01_08245 [Rudaea sp.]
MIKFFCFVMLCIMCVSLASAQSTVPHPRLILDATTLANLRARAAANTSQWQRLKQYCDSFIGGTVNYPDQATYPNVPNIGQGYQGSGYWAPLWSEALCYQTTRVSDPTNAAKYGAKAVDIAVKISIAPGQPHAENPCTDSGFVMRFFGVGMGILYDWVYDVFTPAQRQQIYTTADAWQTNWEKSGGCAAFAYAHPVGNYFAGFFHAKTAMTLAMAGEDPNTPAEWTDWQTRQYTTAAINPPHIGVQPYYAAHMAGGGWPEGFGSYGPLATFNMSLPAWEVKTATGTDLITAPAPYTFPVDVGEYLMHFTWPTRTYIDDRDTNHSNGDSSAPPPSSTDVGMFMQALGVQRYWNSPHANALQQYTHDVVALNGDDADAWEEFLFYDAAGPTAPLATLPLSYFATGPNAIAARSDWTTAATWMSFRAGPYIEGPGAAEEGFDQGSLALVRGGTPLLLNGTGWAVHEPGGNVDENNVYADEFGGFNHTVFSGNRTLYNIFYVRKITGSTVNDPYGQISRSAEDGATTHVAAFEEGGRYVYSLATNLEDMYRLDSNDQAQVASWSREIVYLRPGRFVVYDRTTAGNATAGNTASDQFLAFHVPANPTAGTAPTGEKRFDVNYASNYAGAITTVLPANATTQTLPMYPASTTKKVWQIQIRPPNASAAQKWINVFDLASSTANVATASAVSVTSANAVGTVLVSGTTNQVVLFNANAATTTIAGPIIYSAPKANTSHVITELPSNAGYSVSVVVSGSNHNLTVSPGGVFVTTPKGVLNFAVSAAGIVTDPDVIFADDFGN